MHGRPPLISRMGNSPRCHCSSLAVRSGVLEASIRARRSCGLGPRLLGVEFSPRRASPYKRFGDPGNFKGQSCPDSPSNVGRRASGALEPTLSTTKFTDNFLLVPDSILQPRVSICPVHPTERGGREGPETRLIDITRELFEGLS